MSHTEHEVRLIGRVVASVVHEIRNPLTGAHGYAQLIRDLAEPPFDEYAERILTELERITRYLKRLSQLAPRDSAAFSYRWSLSQVVEEAAAAVFQGEPCPAVKPFVSVPREYYVWGFRSELVRAIGATLTNALESLNGERQIRITASRDNDTVRLSIWNTGPPISPELLPLVCEPFVSTGEGKLGLGLAIVRRIMTDHNGALEVTSGSDHVCVTLVFPVAEPVTSDEPAGEDFRGEEIQ